MEKAMKAQEKGRRPTLLDSEYDLDAIQVPRHNHSKIHHFAEELHLILETPLTSPQPSKCQPLPPTLQVGELTPSDPPQFPPKQTL